MLSFFILGIDLTLNPSPEERDFLAPSPLEKGLGMRALLLTK